MYNSVPPGRYRFELSAHNGDGEWTEPNESLELVVEPHFWQRGWFVGLAGVGGAVGLAGAGRYLERRRTRARLRRLEMERAMERERSRIAQDMHDDLGSSLTEIGFLSTLVRNQSLPGPEGEHYLKQITEKSRELVKALDEIVWAVNPRNDSLPNTVNYLCLFAEELLQAAAIRCRLDVPADFPRRELNAEQRHNLFLAVKEALANAARHSGASEVLLRFEWAAPPDDHHRGRQWAGFDPAEVPIRQERIGEPANQNDKARRAVRCHWRAGPGQCGSPEITHVMKQLLWAQTRKHPFGGIVSDL